MKERMQKKAGICVCFILAIIFASLLTTEYDRKNFERAQSVSSVYEVNITPMESYRTERQQMRQMQKSQLNDIVYGNSSDEEIKKIAHQQLLEIIRMEEYELLLEGILEMRGYGNAIVTIHGESANVILPKETVTQQETAVILELILRETGLESENVKIIPVK